MKKSLITSREKKRQHFLNMLCGPAYDKAQLAENRAQLLNESGDGFQAGLRELIEKFSTPSQYADEEVPSSYGYFSGYSKPKPVAAQIKIIHKQLFPEVKWDFFRPNEDEIAIPDEAEGLFAIPSWQKVARTYSGAVQKILDKIEQTRNGMFHNYRKGQIDEKHLRQSTKSEEFWKNLAEAQGNPDILLVPAQFGIRHRGRSVRRARVVMRDQEVGLGAFAGVCMLLTHPERLQHYDDLWIDLAGDEFDDPGSDVRFAYSPYLLYFRGGRVKFAAGYVGNANDRCGSASVFVPQSGPCSSNP